MAVAKKMNIEQIAYLAAGGVAAMMAKDKLESAGMSKTITDFLPIVGGILLLQQKSESMKFLGYGMLATAAASYLGGLLFKNSARMQVNDLLTVNALQEFDAKAGRILQGACKCDNAGNVIPETATVNVRPESLIKPAVMPTKKEKICTI